MNRAGGTRRQQDGARAEAAARDHLIAHGLQPVAANVRFRGGEIDLVMRDGEQLVFVEVRYRRSDAFGGAIASVDAHKQRRLQLAASLFLQQQPRWAALPCRFDVVTASAAGQALQLHWIRDAFSAA